MRTRSRSAFSSSALSRASVASAWRIWASIAREVEREQELAFLDQGAVGELNLVDLAVHARANRNTDHGLHGADGVDAERKVAQLGARGGYRDGPLGPGRALRGGGPAAVHRPPSETARGGEQGRADDEGQQFRFGG